MTDKSAGDSQSDAWYHNEAFWRECYPYLFPSERFAVADDQARQIVDLLGLEMGTKDHVKAHVKAHVLDLCCGPGRHAVALAQRGVHVTAVDSSRFLLDKAREKAAAANVEINFVRADMRCYVNTQAFDCVLNMYSSFGYFEDPADDLVVLRNIHESLRPGGSCLMDMVSKAWLLSSTESTLAFEEPDGTRFVQRYELLDNNTRQSIEWRLQHGGQDQVFQFYIRIFSGLELKDLMQAAGFSSVDLYGDLLGGSYSGMAERLIAVARKAPG